MLSLPFSLFDPFSVLFVLKFMKYLWQDCGFSISLCTIIGRRPVMSSHLNSRYWAQLSVTSDFSDSLAGLRYELIRWGALYLQIMQGACLFTLILIDTNNVLQREDSKLENGPEDSTSQNIIININIVVENMKRILSVVSLIESLLRFVGCINNANRVKSVLLSITTSAIGSCGNWTLSFPMRN